MLKNRICVLTIFLVMIISNVCFADGRWFTVQEDSEAIISLDTARVGTYGTAKDPYLDCWINLNIIKKKLIFFDHTYIQINNLSYKEAEENIYKNGNFIKVVNKSNEGWKSVTPGSRQEMALLNIIKWANDNTEKLTVR